MSSYVFPRIIMGAVALGALAACDGGFDMDLRNNFGNGFDTSNSVRTETAPRPVPDSRGVISYPGYQVVVANRGDTIQTIATRIGTDPGAMARYNAIDMNTPLRAGEIIALPNRVAEIHGTNGGLTTGPLSSDQVDVATIAGDAINRTPADTNQGRLPQTGTEPIRHKVEAGETAYSIARIYSVSPRALAEWNGLGPDLAVREGQYLLIPVVVETRNADAASSQPGQGTATPVPPSASRPLPREEPVRTASLEAPETPVLEQSESSANQSELLFPVSGSIIRPFEAGSNGGIDISASAGAPVKAAANGTVAAITQDTENVPVLVIRHADNLLTVYANVSDISVSKGDQVSRGQQVAKVRSSDPSFVRFEARRGFDPVDPMPLFN